jgi:hypothetical protein
MTRSRKPTESVSALFILAVHVVLVRWMAAPIATRYVDLDRDQAVAVETRGEHGVNLTCGVATAANFDGRVARCDKLRRLLEHSCCQRPGRSERPGRLALRSTPELDRAATVRQRLA